jgi:hypothetical protein
MAIMALSSKTILSRKVVKNIFLPMGMINFRSF